MEYFLKRRQFEILTRLTASEANTKIAPYVTPRQPHGMFRDWPNDKPYMGESNDSGFDLIQKTRFGMGWPLRLIARFTAAGLRLSILVEARLTEGELMIWRLFWVFAAIFWSLAIFAPSTSFDPLSALWRFVAFAAPIAMIAASEHDFRERVRKSEYDLRKIFELVEKA